MLANSFKVTYIHRALQFDRKAYMKTIFDTFVSKRFEAKMNVEKKIFKLTFNSIFSKICENVRNGSRCDAVTDPKNEPKSFKIRVSHCSRLDTPILSFFVEKRNIILNKNIASGSAILEILENSCFNFITMYVSFIGCKRRNFRSIMETLIHSCWKIKHITCWKIWKMIST